jgi:hypothetical protein
VLRAVTRGRGDGGRAAALSLDAAQGEGGCVQ